MKSRILRWRFHFNAMHNMTPEKEEGKHAHSFLVILCIEVKYMDIDKQNKCEKALKEYFEQFNGQYLNELDAFDGEVPTIEKIGEVVYPQTEQLIADYGMQQIQLEVGDSPVALYSIGKKLLLGGMYREVPDEVFEEYKELFEWRFVEV